MASSTPENKGRKVQASSLIDARGVHYKELNRKIRDLADAGVTHILLKNVRGQRYIGDSITNPDLTIEIQGIPGEDLGYGMGGPTIIVYGHGQNAIANTMDSGKIIIHGLAGDALAYGMRGGKLFVRDDVGYRVGIHMKAYKDKSPVVVVGGTSGDFFGEYMAGGTIILLNRNNRSDLVCGESDKTLGTGIHGGEMYIFGYDVPQYLLGIGALMQEPGSEDRQRLRSIIKEFSADFALEAEPLWNRPFVKIIPEGTRPFAKFYSSAYPTATNLKPQHHERTSPCEAACPAGVPTSRFLRHLRHGEVAQALELLDEATPFRYSCCGFICPHLCMEACTRGKVDFPVRTAELAKQYRLHLPPKKVGTFQGRISVIGGGPAGLTAAYHLARSGYSVTVYDAADRPGGKMYQVISRTRLPLEDLDQDIARIKQLGVKFVTNTRVDAKKLKAILKQSDYVIVAVGAHQGIIPQVRGKEQILPGIDFLKNFNQGKGVNLGDRVLIVGAGDAALDGVEAALHLGTAPEKIMVIDIKTPSGNKEEIEKLKNQGVVFRYPAFLQEVNDKAAFLRDVAGNEESVPADTVIAFISEKPALDFLPEPVRRQVNEKGFFVSDGRLSFRSAHPKISLVGDVSSLGLVTTNIGLARECAREVHAILQGEEYVPLQKDPINPKDLYPERFPDGSFLPLEQESYRCHHCGVCVQCDECVKACPRHALRREGDRFILDEVLCGGCGTCAAACKGGVIQMVPR